MNISNIINRIKALILRYHSLFIISFITLVIVELLNHPSFNVVDLFFWILHHKRVMVMNYIIYCNISMLLYLIINKLNLSNVIFITSLVAVGISNYYKLLLKGENVVLWDVLNLQAATGIMSELKIEISWQVVLAVFVVLVVIVTQLRNKRLKQNKSTRLRYIALIIVLLSTFTIGVIFNNEALNRLKITNMDWNQDLNYSENGFILSFFMNLKTITVTEPDNYSYQSVNEALDRIDSISIDSKVDLEQKANVIVVMNESFADISIANDGIEFQEELTPFINSLDDNVVKGNLLVSIFGGLTANSEFEVLTGNSMAHLPIGSVAYERYVSDDTNSIVGTLKELDYETTAIHPYLETFWDRNKVYETFGFDNFITMDDFADDTPTIKGYISDEAVYEKIVETSTSTSGKDFIFAVSMQNHTPYTDESVEGVPITFDENLYKEDMIKEAGIHASGVQDADNMYKMLVEYYSKQDEPTIIVMFGDHHPFLSSTINQDSKDIDEVNKFKTPFVLWCNYDIDPLTDITIDSTALGAYTLLYADIDLPNYLKYNYYASSIMSGFNNYFVLGKNNEFIKHSDYMDANIAQYLNDHELLQYDLLFGKRYSKDYLWRK